MPGPLTGLRVVDVSIMAAGPWIGALLGQLGAEVIKIEPPAGDGTRWVEPVQHGMGTNYMCLNVNKQGVVLDFKDPADRRDRARPCRDGRCVHPEFPRRRDRSPRPGLCRRLRRAIRASSTARCRASARPVRSRRRRAPISSCRPTRGSPASTAGQATSSRPSASPASSTSPRRSSRRKACSRHCSSAKATGVGQKLEVSMLQAALEMQYTRVAEMLGDRHGAKAAGQPIAGPDAGRRLRHARRRGVRDGAHRCAVARHSAMRSSGPNLRAIRASRPTRCACANREALDAIVDPDPAARPMIWWMRAFERRGVPCALAQHFEAVALPRAGARQRHDRRCRYGRLGHGGRRRHCPGISRRRRAQDRAATASRAPTPRACCARSGARRQAADVERA